MKKVFVGFMIVSLFFILAGCTNTTTTTTTDSTSPKVLSSIEVTTQPSKLVYIEEETLDTTGIVVTAHFSDDTSTDVTSLVTFDKTKLVLGDETVTVTYTEKEVTKTASFSITVNPLKELIGDDGQIITQPSSDLSITTVSTKGDATSYWFSEYQESAFYIKVIVLDESIDATSSVFSSDGVEIMLYHTTRESGIADGTLLINVSCDGTKLVKKASDGAFVNTDSQITATSTKISINGKYVEGYMVELHIPYSELGMSELSKEIVMLPGLYNNQSSTMANATYSSLFQMDVSNTHTFMLVSDDNSYQENPWLQLGYTFGNYGDLVATSSWDVSMDDGTSSSIISMKNVSVGTDNNIYMYRNASPELFAYVKLSASGIYNDEHWGKFGLSVTTEDGLNGFLFFIDASGNGSNMTGANVGIVNKVNGEWVWSSLKTIGTLDNSSVYQDGNFVEFSVYRSNNIFELFINGSSVGIYSGFTGIDASSKAVISLTSFNITLIAKEYGVTSSEEVLSNYRFQTEDVENLFIGDSFIDKAFWGTFNLDFPLDSVNVGVGGTKVPYWEAQLATLSTLYNPENIVIHIGVNDINDEGLTGQEALDRVTQLLTDLETLFPTTMIYYISIEPNNFKPENMSKYEAVNAGVFALASQNNQLNFINTYEALGGQTGASVGQYLVIDGLHMNADGYALWVKTIKQAMNITRVDTNNNLGDTTGYAHSAGWVFDTEYVENQGVGEQQIYFTGINGNYFAASVDINVLQVLNNDQFPKIGFALKSVNKTVYFFIDVNPALNNNWGNYVVRPNASDWLWSEIGTRQYVYLGNTSYSGASSKTLEIVRQGTAIYFISDGRIVQYAEGLFAEDEETALSVLTFNLDVILRNSNIYTETAYDSKLAEYGISEKTGPVIDGDLSDWDSTVLQNSFVIPASNGRSVRVYAFTSDEGVYIAYEALFTGNYTTTAVNWWENTDVEFRIGTDNQRYSSANGQYSRFEDNGLREVGYAVWTKDTVDNINHAIVELFIPWGVIDGYDATSSYVPAGFAWKNPGEEGSIWTGGDYWYVPEADPGMRNALISTNGINVVNDLTLDGDLSDWSQAVLNTTWSGVSGDRTISSAAFLGTDGMYGMFKITTPESINLNTLNTVGDWWLNPNVEIWTNELHSRIMFYNNQVYATGFINQVGYSYDDTTHTLTIEFFVSYHSLGLVQAPDQVLYRIGTNNIAGGWFMPVDPNQAVTSSGLPQ